MRIFGIKSNIAGFRLKQSGNEGENRRFSTAAGTDDGQEFSGSDRKGYVVECFDFPVQTVIGESYIFQ